MECPCHVHGKSRFLPSLKKQGLLLQLAWVPSWPQWTAAGWRGCCSLRRIVPLSVARVLTTPSTYSQASESPSHDPLCSIKWCFLVMVGLPIMNLFHSLILRLYLTSCCVGPCETPCQNLLKAQIHALHLIFLVCRSNNSWKKERMWDDLTCSW